MTFLFRVPKKNQTSFKSFRFKALLGEMNHIGRIAMGCVGRASHNQPKPRGEFAKL